MLAYKTTMIKPNSPIQNRVTPRKHCKNGYAEVKFLQLKRYTIPALLCYHFCIIYKLVKFSKEHSILYPAVCFLVF